MSKIEQWEITLPVPLVISEDISDEDIIGEMTSATTDAEISAIISSAFKGSDKAYIVSCAREDLPELMSLDSDDYIVELEEYNDMYVVMILDLGGNVVGRGEIFRAGKKVTKDKFHQEFDKSIKEFDKAFKNGQKRMNNLVYKLKTIRNVIDKTGRDPGLSN